MSATVCMNDGDTHNNPIEQMEAKFPLMYLKHGLRQNSGGPGRFRGGLGTEQIIMARSGMNFNAQVDRMHCQPWGLDGGLSGMRNQVNLNQSGEVLDKFTNAKVLLKRLNKGDTFTLLTGGGGGFGPPDERDPERVKNDLRQEYICKDSAKNIYKVAVLKSGNVDIKATNELRNKAKKRV